MRIYVIVIIFAIILGSCLPVLSPEPALSTFPTAIVLLSTTSTPKRTKSTPPATMVLTPTQLPTLTVTFSPDVSPTLERIEFSMQSPDGTMAVQTKDWEIFEILNKKNGQVMWSFAYDKSKFGSNNYLSEAYYEPYYWSGDGKYIYVKIYHGTESGAVKYWGNVFGAVKGLVRFDVDTGKMSEILKENLEGGYTFVISPDEKGIVYTNQSETPLVLRWRDLLGNKEKTLLAFDKQIYDVGSFGWSPNMDRLIFSTLRIQNSDQTPQDFLFDFFVMDLEDLHPHMVLQRPEDWLNFEYWDQQDGIFYTDWQNTVWRLDLNTKTLSAIGTATPNP
jgi:hypothetical protein